MVDDGTGVGGSSKNIQVGEAPPSDPEFYLNWGRENEKEAIKRADAALGQLLTLSASIFGGAIAFWERIPIVAQFKFGILFILLATVFISLYSAMPMEGRFDRKSAADIRDHMRHTLEAKTRRLIYAKCSLLAALALMMLGLAAGTFR